jgi:predicted Zn-dependent protease
MLRTNLWNDSASRVAFDQRAREAHLQLERNERLLVPRVPMTPSRRGGFSVVLRSAFYLRLWAGQHDLAIEHAETALRLSPRERAGTPLSLIGEAYFFKREFEEAASKLLLSVQENPGYPHSYRILAACYVHMGQLEEARAIIARLRGITAHLVPSAAQLRRAADRELFLSGLRMAVGETV